MSIECGYESYEQVLGFFIKCRLNLHNLFFFLFHKRVYFGDKLIG